MLTVMNEENLPIAYARTSDGFRLHGQFARFSYTLHTRYNVCIGADKAVNFVYPFGNEHEWFLGSGALPYPAITYTGEMRIRLTLLGLRDDWRVFSNMQFPAPDRATLHGFFLYASADLQVTSFHTETCAFHFAAQKPNLDIAALWNYLTPVLDWMNHHLVPFQPSHDLNVLILEAPRQFELIGGYKTFATGENFYGGIVTYGPRNPSYLEKLFGYNDYDEFLRDGFVHELFHFYASSNPLSAKKSLLYPSPSCDPYIASLLGESLIGYLHRQYVTLGIKHSLVAFLQVAVAKTLAEGRIDRMASWFVFDAYLRERGSSLLACFRRWLEMQAGQPFTELDEFLKVMATVAQHPLPDYLLPILWKRPPDQYLYVVEGALKRVGYEKAVVKGVPTVAPALEAPTVVFELPAYQSQ
ncbi:MAG: hypothetical protein KF716_26785 [Anaerolineae bacterium]|nr:hypothetical protein [Anaerolineae bacterium]